MTTEGGTRLDAAPRETRYIPTLDGWRAVAITIVLVQHASDQITRAVGDWIAPVTDHFKANGRFGVYVFFAISGYLITTLLLDETDRTGTVRLSSFYVRRAFRILPPLLVLLGTLGVLGLAGVLPIPVGRWVGSLFFVNNYTAGHSWYLAHLWSLAIEEQFYLVWPTLLVLARPRRAFGLCAGLIALVVIWRLIDSAAGLTASWPIYVDDRTDVRADGLLWGCLLAIGCRRPATRGRIAAITAGWRWWAVLAVLVALQASDVEGVYAENLTLTLRPILIALLVVGTVLRPTTRLARELERPAWRWVGRISYSLYLWQQLFLAYAGEAVDALAWCQWFPFSVVCAFALAVLSHRFVERPAITAGRRLAASLRRERASLRAAT